MTFDDYDPEWAANLRDRYGISQVFADEDEAPGHTDLMISPEAIDEVLENEWRPALSS